MPEKQNIEKLKTKKITYITKDTRLQLACSGAHYPEPSSELHT